MFSCGSVCLFPSKEQYDSICTCLSECTTSELSERDNIEVLQDYFSRTGIDATFVEYGNRQNDTCDTTWTHKPCRTLHKECLYGIVLSGIDVFVKQREYGTVVFAECFQKSRNGVWRIGYKYIVAVGLQCSMWLQSIRIYDVCLIMSIHEGRNF